MNAKDKAIELVEKFSAVESLKDYEGMDFQLAKECATICVDKIIEYQPFKDLGFTYNSIDSRLDASKDFWNEVKKQIELL